MNFFLFFALSRNPARFTFVFAVVILCILCVLVIIFNMRTGASLHNPLLLLLPLPLDCAFVFGLLFISFGFGFGFRFVEAHDAPYWPAAWTAVHIDIHHLGSSLRFISFSQAAWQINGRDKVAVVGRCSPRPRPSTDPDMAARLRLQLRIQLQLQIQSQLEYGSFRANDIKKHIMAPLWKVVVVVIAVCCVPGMRFGQKAKGRSTANCCGTLICIVKSSANPAHFAELSA